MFSVFTPHLRDTQLPSGIICDKLKKMIEMKGEFP